MSNRMLGRMVRIHVAMGEEVDNHKHTAGPQPLNKARGR